MAGSKPASPALPAKSALQEVDTGVVGAGALQTDAAAISFVAPPGRASGSAPKEAQVGLPLCTGSGAATGAAAASPGHAKLLFLVSHGVKDLVSVGGPLDVSGTAGAASAAGCAPHGLNMDRLLEPKPSGRRADVADVTGTVGTASEAGWPQGEKLDGFASSARLLVEEVASATA